MNKIVALSFPTLILLSFLSTATADELQTAGITPFSEIPATYPPNLKGNDLKALIKSLTTTKESSGLIKDEFTSTADYLAKVKKVADELNGTGAYIFVVPVQDQNAIGAVRAKYNPEEKRYDITMSLKQFGYNGNGMQKELIGLNLVKDTVSQSRYEASNAYGKSMSVSQMTFDVYSIAYNGFASDGLINLPYAVPIEEAKLLKNDMAIVFVCKIKAPILTENTDRTSPKIDAPYDFTYKNHILNVAPARKNFATLIQVSTGKVLKEIY